MAEQRHAAEAEGVKSAGGPARVFLEGPGARQAVGAAAPGQVYGIHAEPLRQPRDDRRVGPGADEGGGKQHERLAIAGNGVPPVDALDVDRTLSPVVRRGHLRLWVTGRHPA